MEALLIDSPPPGVHDAEDSAREWTKYFLNESFIPPESLRYVALPRAAENGCDRLRLRYRVTDVTLTISQSIGIFCVQMSQTDQRTAASNVEGAEEIARKLFRRGSEIRLREDKPLFEGGGAVPNSSSTLPWLKTLRWKKTNQGFAFLMLKDDGHPRMAAVGAGLDTNEYWYSKHE